MIIHPMPYHKVGAKAFPTFIEIKLTPPLITTFVYQIKNPLLIKTYRRYQF
ncbi:hypothetical protein ABIB62_001353 [Mucilaginibacter sp. UYP25]